MKKKNMLYLFAGFFVLALVFLLVSFGQSDQFLGKIQRVSTKSIDLTISNLEVTPESPQIGDKIKIGVKVSNQGQSTANGFTVSAKDQTGWGSVSGAVNLPAGKSKIVYLTLLASEKNRAQLLANNPHNFNIAVDPKNLIKETNEGNNTQQTSITIQSDQKSPIAAKDFKIRSDQYYNNERSVLIEWTDSSPDVSYQVFFHSPEVGEALNILSPDTTYGMAYYTQETSQNLTYWVSQEDVTQEFINDTNSWVLAETFGYTYTRETGYNATTIRVPAEDVTEYAVITTTADDRGVSRALRIYYQTPAALQVYDLKPTEISSIARGVTLQWTNQGEIWDGNQYSVMYYSSTEPNPFNLDFYSGTTKTTQEGLEYKVTDPGKDFEGYLQSFDVIEVQPSSPYEHYSFVSDIIGNKVYTFIIFAENNLTDLSEVSNVIEIDNRFSENAVTREELAYTIVTQAGYPRPVTCTQQPYPDVDMNSFYCPYIQAAKDFNAMPGEGDGNFYPQNQLNRAEVARIYQANAFKLAPNISENAPHFIDINPADWFYEGVETLYSYVGYDLGYYVANPDEAIIYEFRPGETATDEWSLSLAQQLPDPPLYVQPQ